MKQNNTKKYLLLISVALVLVLITAFASGCSGQGEDTTTAITTAEITKGAEQSQKTITVTIVFSDENQKTVDIVTSGKTLREALDEKELIGGEDSTSGFFVTEVDGVKAEDDLRQWWSFSKNGEPLMTGVDTTPISDGDTFEIALSVY